MLYIENLIIKGKEYTYTYSDTYTIERDGIEYYEAIDPAESDRKYIETTNLKAGIEDISIE